MLNLGEGFPDLPQRKGLPKILALVIFYRKSIKTGKKCTTELKI